jgi:hypothetical protein
VRVIECAELLAADLFKNADQTRQRTTLDDVDVIWPSWPAIPVNCTCGRCVLAPRGTPHRDYAIASGWQRQVRMTRVRALR